MTINLNQVISDLEQASGSHDNFYRQQRHYCQEAVERFKNITLSNAELLELIQSATNLKNRTVRSAAPLSEPVAQIFAPPSSASSKIILVGIDGSHIAPEPARGRIEFALTNLVGVSCIIDTNGTLHDISYHPATNIYVDNDLIMDDGEWMDGEDISLIRSIRERELLASVMQQREGNNGSVLGILDGTLNIWRPMRNESETIRDYRTRASQIFEDMRLRNHVCLAYLDRPNSDQVLQMLRIAAPVEINNSEKPETRPRKGYPGLRDRVLFEALLPPGYRSAIYRLLSQGLDSSVQEIPICFFYINVASKNEGSIIGRVELPIWASAPEIVDLIHITLVRQCSLVPGFAYPLILARADEESWLGPSDRAILDQLIYSHLGFETVAMPRPKNLMKMVTRGWQK